MLADIERIHGSPIIDGVCTSGGNDRSTLSSYRGRKEIPPLCTPLNIDVTNVEIIAGMPTLDKISRETLNYKETILAPDPQKVGASELPLVRRYAYNVWTGTNVFHTIALISASSCAKGEFR